MCDAIQSRSGDGDQAKGMSDRKYQIFISSTYEDLKEERRKVSDAILKICHFPVGMEIFSASDECSWEIIRKTLDTSDYYILLLGHRYGTLITSGENAGLSYTHNEYRYAISRKIPVLAFLESDEVRGTEDKFESDPDKKKKLDEFRAEVKSSHNVEWWTSPDDLATNVVAALHKDISEANRPGWVHEDSVAQGIQNLFHPAELDRKIRIFLRANGGQKGEHASEKLAEVLRRTDVMEVYKADGKAADRDRDDDEIEECDVRIFLLDRAVLADDSFEEQIHLIKRKHLFTWLYICDQDVTEETPEEISLGSCNFVKHKLIHQLEDLPGDGLMNLIGDIIWRYHESIHGFKQDDTSEDAQEIDLSGIECRRDLNLIPKSLAWYVDRCSEYLQEFVFHWEADPDAVYARTSEVDQWCCRFLPILLRGKSICDFNTYMFLDELKKHQSKELHSVVRFRWNAIQAYFLDDPEECVHKLEEALDLAKPSGQLEWVKKDILIDLRNMQHRLGTAHNKYFGSDAEKELDESETPLYYPILDRVKDSLHEVYIEDFYKEKIKSPLSVTYGNNAAQHVKNVAIIYVIAMYNGSLSQILSLYEELRKLMFCLCGRFDDWDLHLNLYTLVLFSGSRDEIRKFRNAYPEIVNCLSADDALSVMQFCDNRRIGYERRICRLAAFGAVGYHLDDTHFAAYENKILNDIEEWIQQDNSEAFRRTNIFECLSGISERTSQDKLAKICCLVMEKQYRFWYSELFKFLAGNIRLDQMSAHSAQALVGHIISILNDDKGRDQISNTPDFLFILRKQNRPMTEEMDRTVALRLPQFYSGNYLLETTVDVRKDYPQFVQELIAEIRTDNVVQGVNGVYNHHRRNAPATLWNILIRDSYACDPVALGDILSVTADMLLISRESAERKIDAVSLLTGVVLKYPNSCSEHKDTLDTLYERQNDIRPGESFWYSTKVDEFALKVCVQFLFTAMGKDTYARLLEYMPQIQGKTADTIKVSCYLDNYLHTSETVQLPGMIEGLVLQYALQWLHEDNLYIRKYAVRILFCMLRNPNNEGTVNNQLIQQIDSGNMFIKILILREAAASEAISEKVRQYILNRGRNDENYMVRKTYGELVQDNMCKFQNE